MFQYFCFDVKRVAYLGKISEKSCDDMALFVSMVFFKNSANAVLSYWGCFTKNLAWRSLEIGG
jgi:hypothetical protein